MKEEEGGREAEGEEVCVDGTYRSSSSGEISKEIKLSSKWVVSIIEKTV